MLKGVDMYFSRVRISPQYLDEFAKQFQYNYYQQHQLLWKLFRDESEKKRDFLFRQDTDNQGLPVYYILSETKPSQSINYLHVETKPFSLQLKTGDLLAFNLRANPVRKLKRCDESFSPEYARRDVVIHLKKTLEKELSSQEKHKEDLPSQAAIEQQAGECWLKHQAKDKGFKIHSVIAEGYQQHQFKKRSIKISTLDFQGILQITDPELFFSEVFYGVI
ncbi:partial CRISPR system Cascade subunit CasE, partial [uncultured bacterium]